MLSFEGPTHFSMLREIAHVQQRPGEPRRRWFHCSEQDLYVWTDNVGAIVAFELCYSKGRNERAVVWKNGCGLAHFRVDDGEASALFNSSPILKGGQCFDLSEAQNSFIGFSGNVPAEIVDFVSARLR